MRTVLNDMSFVPPSQTRTHSRAHTHRVTSPPCEWIVAVVDNRLEHKHTHIKLETMLIVDCRMCAVGVCASSLMLFVLIFRFVCFALVDKLALAVASLYNEEYTKIFVAALLFGFNAGRIWARGGGTKSQFAWAHVWNESNWIKLDRLNDGFVTIKCSIKLKNILNNTRPNLPSSDSVFLRFALIYYYIPHYCISPAFSFYHLPLPSSSSVVVVDDEARHFCRISVSFVCPLPLFDDDQFYE